jgi:NTE family protein
MENIADSIGPSVAAPRVNLALQGGGSHGAFTWGVLDALLADGRMHFDGISGTSAGAMNAVAMAFGYNAALAKGHSDPREAAREGLAAFWEGVVHMGTVAQPQSAIYDVLFGASGMAALPGAGWINSIASEWTHVLSPYAINPMDINPLRNFLESQIDFDVLAHGKGIKVFVVATHVASGQAEVFWGKRLTADAVMASACLPLAFQAVEIDGEHYWDGGYSGNPAIHPLIYHCDASDVLLVQINPIRRSTIPTTSAQIIDRINEITFNAGLIAEMRAIDFVARLHAEGKLDPKQYKNILLHRIDGGETLDGYSAATKVSTSGVLIRSLHELGVTHAKEWLEKKFHALGQHSSIHIKHDYLDSLRLPVK